MTKATTIKGTKVLLYLGDDSTPVEYTAPCGLNGKSVRFTKNTNEVEVPDCEDPEAAAWLERDVVSISIDGDGEGVLAEQSVEDWLDAWHETDPVPAKIEFEFPGKTITYTGEIHVTSFEVTGQRGSRATCAVQFASHGEMTKAVTTPD